jgi:outer membrane protein assembly factor BamA
MLRTILMSILFGGMMMVAVSSVQGEEKDSLTLAETEFSPPPDSVFVVEKILVVGNEKTKEYVLLREMTLKQGDYITADAMEYDKKRIYSLGLFTRVEIGYLPTTPPRANLVIFVSERWYIYPFPLLGIKDRDWKKLYFGGGIMHLNFRGRNEKIYAAFTLGYDPMVTVSYRNPLIDDENNYFLNTSLAWRVVRNRSPRAIGDGVNFDERHLSAGMDFGKRFGLHHTGWVSAAYEVIKVSEYRSGRTLSPDGVDAFPLLSVGYMYDTRDLWEYAMSGSFARATITKYGIAFRSGSSGVDFMRSALDIRRFIPITQRVSLAGRVYTDLSAGIVLPYGRVFLGYSERIRGHFSQVLEGEYQLGTSWELRVMLMEPRYFTVDAVPVPEFAVWKFGIAAAVFGDAGTVWFRDEPLALDRFVRGYGVGLHFILPYGFVLRTEYALNEIRNGEFILDLSAAF